MNLYLDDNISKGRLADRLRRAGHQVTVPAAVGLVGVTDARHFLHALQSQLALLTRDHDDFFVLHRIILSSRGQHAGILVVRADNDPSHDMKDGDIVKALSNLEQSGVPIR